MAKAQHEHANNHLAATKTRPQHLMLPDGNPSCCDYRAPGLVESLMTDAGSSVSSAATLWLDDALNDNTKLTVENASFSQLLKRAAANNGDSRLGNSFASLVSSASATSNRETQDKNTVVDLIPPGTLISSPMTSSLREPLLTFTTGHEKQTTSILGNSLYGVSLARAKCTIRSVIEDHLSFEVAMDLADPEFTVQNVMDVLGNPNLLKYWFDPVKDLVVTRTTRTGLESESDVGTSGVGDRAREYDGEWIEATTTALECPPSVAGSLLGTGQAILQKVGLASHGNITMFFEQSRGRASFSVGPFPGGIYVAHSITAVKKIGAVKLVDRVCLTRGKNSTGLLSCVLPPLGSHVEQVKTSFGRLRLLLESEKRLKGS